MTWCIPRVLYTKTRDMCVKTKAIREEVVKSRELPDAGPT